MFYLAQAGSSLQRVDPDGTVTTLTLPSGVTIDATINGIFAVLGSVIIFAKASSINLLIDPTDFSVSALGIGQPVSAPTLAAGSGTGLTGTYQAKVAYATKNAAGVIVNMSPLSQASAPVSVTNQNIVYSAIPISPDAAVNCRVLFRTAASGTVYFKFLEIDDNVSTTVTDATSDAALSLLPASTAIGNPPGTVPGTAMRLLIEWKGRLWGVSDTLGERDDARFTEIGVFYEWDPFNSIPANPKGEDEFGIIAFVRRRDDLGVLKRARVMKIIGDNPDNFEMLILAENVGCIAPESVVVIRNKAYWLGHDGVYRWDDDGIVCLSRASVDPWFTTDTYFNRDRFEFAFGGWNPVTNAYELNLANVGDTTENRWIAFHIDANGGQGEWLGPHKTAAFTPTARGLLKTDEGINLPVIGASDGYLYLQNQTTPSDVSGAAATSAIDGQLQTKWHSDGAPDVVHFWGRLAVLSRVESAGTTLTVTPTVGRLNGSAGAALTYDLTLGRQIGRRLGVGPLCTIVFRQNTAGKRFLLFGYEITPVFEVGRR